MWLRVTRLRKERRRRKSDFWYPPVPYVNYHFVCMNRLSKCKITRRTQWWRLEDLKWLRFRYIFVFVMYYVYGMSGPSLLIVYRLYDIIKREHVPSLLPPPSPKFFMVMISHTMYNLPLLAWPIGKSYGPVKAALKGILIKEETLNAGQTKCLMQYSMISILTRSYFSQDAWMIVEVVLWQKTRNDSLFYMLWSCCLQLHCLTLGKNCGGLLQPHAAPFRCLKQFKWPRPLCVTLKKKKEKNLVGEEASWQARTGYNA